MADALLGDVFGKLLSLAHNELETISGIKGKVETLTHTLEQIKAVVEDAEEKQITDKPIKVWLQRLKDAVYVLDDILDECSIESHRLAGLSSLIKPKNIIFCWKIGDRLKEITRRFDDIDDSRKKFILWESVRGRRDEVADPEERETWATIHEPELYGRQEEKENIVEFLLSEERNSALLSVNPIVGLGGMGKTTLSRMVYNDARVSSNFNQKIWICVSENFSVKGILCSVVNSISGGKCDDLDSGVIHKKVQELLQSKRYLLVLDDVWNTNQQIKFGLSEEKWNQLKSILSCGSKGASVLISTRDMDVAEIMGTCQAQRLQGLSKDDCWLLFKQYAFVANHEERAELVAIGKEIVKKCGGLPLAARALGGLLRLKNEVKEWLEVKESTLWNLPDERCIWPALMLSYFHLTPTLRQCFAFCAMFPKDTIINKEDLIFLWMANGFISSRENMEVEDVGNSIWNELCRKSFFQDISTNFKGKTSFKMHDLVHDLAESVMRKECVILDSANITNLSANTHHVFYCYREGLSFNPGTFNKVESLRALYQFLPYFGKIYAYLPTHHTLRVLRTSSSNLSSLGSLIHLRYLELYEIVIETLPDSIYSLKKLEILKLKSLYNFICLPKHLTRLQNLRHLIIERCLSLLCMFPNIGKLSSLRTLSVYIVSSKIGHSLAELHDLRLGGNLHIKGLENVGSLSEAQDANLKGKSDLHKLFLSWGSSEETRSHATNPDQVLEGLQPHLNLKELGIHNYAGLKSPSWIGMLSNLVELQLHHCNKCMKLSSIGKLPSLRRLELEGMKNMKYIDDDESYDGVEVRAFPSLEELKLMKLPKLERLLKVGKGEMFPRLSELCIEICFNLELPSCIPSLTSLVLVGYTNELLRSVSHFTGITSLGLNYGQVGLTSFPVELFNNLNALEDLRINGCGELECLTEQAWEGLHSLRFLQIYSCSRLRSLPDGIQHLNALEELLIEWCGELECLPEQGWEGLCSLRFMEIRSCRRLRSFPDGVRHLTSLETLSIWDCPELKERCKEGTGEDWDKIAHVPKVFLS